MYINEGLFLEAIDLERNMCRKYSHLAFCIRTIAIAASGSTSKTNLHKIQTKQNRVIRFLATLSGKNTDSSLPLLNILVMLTVANVYRLHALKFIYAWHIGVLPELFNHFFQYASNMHNYNNRYAAKQNLHKCRVKTNTGKKVISFMAIDQFGKNCHTSLKTEINLLSPKVLKTIFYLSNIKT